MSRDALKRRAAERTVREVSDGDIVGLGSGSTAAFAIRELGDRVDAGLDVRGVPTSFQAREIALDVGIPVVDLDQVDGVDVAIDGADQVVDDVLIKGGGGAHAREKLVDATADRFLVIVDPSKLADRIDYPVPVEVIPAARSVVADRLRSLGGEPELRRAEHKSGPVVTDNGNLLLDCAFDAIDEPAALAADLSALPGVLEHGLFVDLADAVYVGREDGVDVLEFDSDGRE